MSISDGFVKTNLYDKRGDFEFDTANFPFLDGDVPRSTSYGVLFLNVFVLLELMTLKHVIKFYRKILKQGYKYHKLRKT